MVLIVKNKIAVSPDGGRAHAFNPSTGEAEAEFKASLVYRATSRTGSKATQRNVSKLPPPRKPSQQKVKTGSVSLTVPVSICLNSGIFIFPVSSEVYYWDYFIAITIIIRFPSH